MAARRRRASHIARRHSNLARDHDAAKLQWANDIRHHQDGPARPRQDDAGLERVSHVAAGARRLDKDDARCPGVPRHQLGRQLKSGAPFRLLEMLSLNAGVLTHLLETSVAVP